MCWRRVNRFTRVNRHWKPRKKGVTVAQHARCLTQLRRRNRSQSWRRAPAIQKLSDSRILSAGKRKCRTAWSTFLGVSTRPGSAFQEHLPSARIAPYFSVSGGARYKVLRYVWPPQTPRKERASGVREMLVKRRAGAP